MFDLLFIFLFLSVLVFDCVIEIVMVEFILGFE